MELTMRRGKFRFEVLYASVYLQVKDVLDYIKDDPDNQLIAEDITRRVMSVFSDEVEYR